MNPSVQPRLVVHLSIPKVRPLGDDGGAQDTPACGWYESSFALRQGLAVSELPDSDGSVAALWFAALDSACLQ
ncbi:MAG: hypothetical protein V4795_24900 [Pseudomonadota bacterium]